MKFLDRPLAITDIETTGLDAQIHEIVELAVLIVDQKTLKVSDSYSAKIRPTNIRKAARKALQVSGYNEKDWRNAVDLEVAMEIYGQKTRNAIFSSHNVFFDWSFIAEAFKKTGVEDYTDYHRADLFSIAWARTRGIKGFTDLNATALCKRLEIPPEPLPHRALAGAKLQHRILQTLLKLP